MKNVGQLTSKFDLDQSEGKSSQVYASARKAYPNEVTSRQKFSTDFRLLAIESVWLGLYTTVSSTRIKRIQVLRKAYLEHLKVVFIVPQIVQKFHVFVCSGSNLKNLISEIKV